MNEIEKRARELLAAEYERSGKRMAAEFASLGTSEHQPAINAIIAALSAAPQVPENVMRNAERYRWLRNLPVDASNRDSLDVVLWVDELGGCPRRDDLDAEIDAAMLAAKPGPQV